MARKLPPDPDQGTFGFTRGGQLQAFRKAKFPAITICEGKQQRIVKPRDIRCVLRVIDDHGPGCWVSIDTIAAESDMSRRSVLRAMKAISMLDLLCVESMPLAMGGYRNRYTINWQAVAHYTPPVAQCPTGTTAVPSRVNRSAHWGTLSAQEAPNEPPPPTPSTKTAVRQDSWRAVEDEFRGQLSITKLIAWAAPHGYTPETLALELRQALQTARLPANAQRLESPEGAAVAFLRNGRWPVDGIITAADSERLARDAAERDRARREFLEREAALDRQIAAERAAAKSQASNALEASL